MPTERLHPRAATHDAGACPKQIARREALAGFQAKTLIRVYSLGLSREARSLGCRSKTEERETCTLALIFGATGLAGSSRSARTALLYLRVCVRTCSRKLACVRTFSFLRWRGRGI